jgi:dTDP-4-amino-4,6-dideoxygalactose transaminase
VKIPLVDLKAQYNSIKAEIDQAISQTIQSSQFILGSEVKSFEAEIADYIGVKYAIGVASGTEALQLALLACGIKPGDEVITTPFTFIATVEVITQCDATPVFVDIDPATYNINPADIETKVNKKTKAIIPVHLYGQSTEMNPILELSKKYNLRVIEDCAQSMGAEYKGNKVGSLGDAGCFSFFPSKILGAYGDGGMIVTNNPEIAERIGMLRDHGRKQKYYYLIPGFNSRLDEIQAAILRVKLRHLTEWIALRQQKAALYSKLITRIDGVQPPYIAPDNHHVFNYYTIRIEKRKLNREKLQKHLSDRGIATAIYYPLSLHLQPAYAALDYQPGDLAQSELAQEEVLSLPIYPELDEEQIEIVVESIKAFGE